jgi:hypothetical protein
MNKDLTSSDIQRKNILNNNYVLKIIYDEISFSGVMFEKKYRFTKKQVAKFFEIDERTINRYIEKNKPEFEESGYEVLKYNRLKEFKLSYVKDTDVPNIDESLQKTPSLGVFTLTFFRVEIFIHGLIKYFLFISNLFNNSRFIHNFSSSCGI